MRVFVSISSHNWRQDKTFAYFFCIFNIVMVQLHLLLPGLWLSEFLPCSRFPHVITPTSVTWCSLSCPCALFVFDSLFWCFLKHLSGWGFSLLPQVLNNYSFVCRDILFSWHMDKPVHSNLFYSLFHSCCMKKKEPKTLQNWLYPHRRFGALHSSSWAFCTRRRKNHL